MKKYILTFLCVLVFCVTGCSCNADNNSDKSSPNSLTSNSNSISSSTSNINSSSNSLISSNSSNSLSSYTSPASSSSSSSLIEDKPDTDIGLTKYQDIISAYFDGATINDANFASYVKNLEPYNFNATINGNAIYASPNGNGDGTYQSPFSLQDAFDSVQAGQTIYLLGGTYNPSNSEGFSLDMKGTADNYIKIRNYPNESVVITNTNSGDEVYALTLGETLAYTQIEGLEIASVVGKCAYGMVSWGKTNHLILRNCNIHDIKTNSKDPENDSSAGANAILLFGESNTAISNVAIIDNYCHDNITGWSETLSVTANCEYVYVIKNTVKNNTNIGIDFYGNAEGYCKTPSLNQPRYCLASGNTIENSFCSYADCAGLYVDGARDIILQGNLIKNCQYGIEIGSEEKQVDYPVKNITVRNNICENNSVVAIRIGGYETDKTGVVYSTKILNNTLIDNASQIIFAKCDGITVKNNALYSSKNVETVSTEFSNAYCKNISIVNNFISLFGKTESSLEFNMFETTQTGLNSFNSLVGTNYIESFEFDEQYICTSSILKDKSQTVDFGTFDFHLSSRTKNTIADIGACEN